VLRTVYSVVVFFSACRKFCEKGVNLYIILGKLFFFFGVLKRYIGIFMAHNYNHNFYLFYFWRIKNGCLVFVFCFVFHQFSSVISPSLFRCTSACAFEAAD
jgi:hypothetical protein